jgi:hypothetical protein
MDGLVSTGNKFPYTILKIVFSNTKIFFHNFIHIFIFFVNKRLTTSKNKITDTKIQEIISYLLDPLTLLSLALEP